MSNPTRKNALTTNMLNRKILIQSKTISVDSEAIATTVWTTIMTLFAFREPLPMKGKEYLDSAAELSKKVVRYKSRYRTGITAAMRILDGNAIYQIITPLDDVFGDRTETHIIAVEYEDG